MCMHYLTDFLYNSSISFEMSLSTFTFHNNGAFLLKCRKCVYFNSAAAKFFGKGLQVKVQSNIRSKIGVNSFNRNILHLINRRKTYLMTLQLQVCNNKKSITWCCPWSVSVLCWNIYDQLFNIWHVYDLHHVVPRLQHKIATLILNYNIN